MIRPLSPFDVDMLEVQEKQKAYRQHIKDAALSCGLTNAFTYIEKDGIKAVFGMQDMWPGRAVVWALIGSVGNWSALHRGVKKLMEHYSMIHNVSRLEMTTEVGFDESEKWAKMLGFKEESLMPNFGVDGKDHKMWVILWQQQSLS